MEGHGKGMIALDDAAETAARKRKKSFAFAGNATPFAAPWFRAGAAAGSAGSPATPGHDFR